ncbi:sensor domain-containing diguanylate cyclase [Ferrimonas balearica]|uniref:GGDEF domain-containing protein n=1 Tax=Ferrimonas balearica TaxID=44012 RepID=UPI002D7EBF26|nr:GGDEF domain-containing protein [Ferrimonas balearica]MBY6018792.1 GGDEF domain-containing protein [Halomonas denitrificans]MBY6095982.1 GGDEF domain-containing protein [Ferrimonas balearica]
MSSSDRILLILLLLLIPTALWAPGYLVMHYPELTDPLLYLPWLTLGATLLLSQIYHQGRLGFMVILTMLIYGLIQSQLQAPLHLEGKRLLFWLMGLMGPLLALLLALLPERVPFSRQSLGHWLLLAAGSGLLLALSQVPVLAQWVTGFLTPRAFLLTEHSPAPLLMLAWQTLIAVGLWALYLRKRESASMAALLVVVGLILVCLGFARPMISATLLAVVGVALFVVVLQQGHQMAFLDELTGIPGRRALNMALKRVGRRYSLAMMDIDHFKKFNDTYGHDVGDEVLKLVASRLTRVKGGGQVFRYGGEEFTVLFPGKAPKACAAHLEAIREDIADYPFVVRKSKSRPEDEKAGRQQRGQGGGGKTVQITISMGLAERTGEQPDAESVIKAADQALYKAKKAGRNCLKLA